MNPCLAASSRCASGAGAFAGNWLQRAQQPKLGGRQSPKRASAQVLAGFDAKGVPQLHPAQKPITQRNLLMHTSGFSYLLWDPNVVRNLKVARSNPSLPRMPLMFEPGPGGPMAAVWTGSAGWWKSPAGKAWIAISAITSLDRWE
jgi:hypothetical protein